MGQVRFVASGPDFLAMGGGDGGRTRHRAEDSFGSFPRSPLLEKKQRADRQQDGIDRVPFPNRLPQDAGLFAARETDLPSAEIGGPREPACGEDRKPAGGQSFPGMDMEDHVGGYGEGHFPRALEPVAAFLPEEIQGEGGIFFDPQISIDRERSRFRVRVETD